jgi:nitrate/TMAO reductase-like tetraheme cytochrome c subunit
VKLRDWLSSVVYLANNWISFLGVLIVTTSTIFWLFLLPTTLGGGVKNPYLGILSYMGVPSAFFLGLLLIPLGVLWTHRRELRKGKYPASFPPLTLQNPQLRRLAIFIVAITFVNLVVASQGTYAAITYMDQPNFCGQTCHVMKPEFTAYQNSPHSRVDCVTCHIGAGAGWFVRSKLSGVGQVFAVAFNTYPRPIPTPVRNLRPARETCETCHWPQKFDEDRLRIISKFGDDAANTQTKTVMFVRIGGGERGVGIHGAHLGPGVHIRYGHSDEARQIIPWVEYNNQNTGRKTNYLVSGTRPDASGLTVREMDCLDCHNRPAHAFELPERAVDAAMSGGSISTGLPFVRKTSVALLKKNYASDADAAVQIPAAFASFYQQKYPDVWAKNGNDVNRAARAVLDVYQRNVFPDLKVTWGTHPNNLGHADYPGCFRCHDENHATPGKKTISQDCNLCHQVLAVDEASPEILKTMGLDSK